MNKLNTGFTKLPDDVFDNKAQTIVAALTGNTAFPTTKESRLPVATRIQLENAASFQGFVLLSKGYEKIAFRFPRRFGFDCDYYNYFSVWRRKEEKNDTAAPADPYLKRERECNYGE